MNIMLLLFVCAFSAIQILNADIRGHAFSVALWDTPADGVSYSYDSLESSELKPMELQKMVRSDIYYTSDHQIKIHVTGNDGAKKVIAVTLNPHYKSSLLVLKKNAAGYEVISIADDPQSIVYGSYLLINSSKLNLKGKFGEKDIILAAGSRLSLQPRAEKGAALGLELWHEPNGKKEFLQRNTLTYSPNKYLIVVLYTTQDRMGRVKLESRGIVAMGGQGDTPSP